MQDDPVVAFNTRYSAIAAEGCVGAEIFERLAADASLPIYFDENQAAEIAGLTPSALKQRRYRRMKPTFLNHGARSVRYTQADASRLALESLLKRTKDANTRVTVEAVLKSLDVVLKETVPN